MAEFYTAEQVAELLGLHTKTIRRYIREGRIEARRIGKQYRVTDGALRAFTGEAAFASSARAQAPAGARVFATVEVDGLDASAARRLTDNVMAAAHRVDHARADCIYYQAASQLKVLLFGSIEFTDHMLKHINVLLDREPGWTSESHQASAS